PVAYWRAIDPGLHIGYRKSKNGGVWVARWYLRGVQPQSHQADGTVYKHSRGKAYHHETLKGMTDDKGEADGLAVLSFAQAQKRVRELYAASNAPSSPTGPITVKTAIERYIAYLKAEKKTGADAEQRLALHVSRELGGQAVATLTTEEVEAFKRRMVKRDPEDPEVERRSRDSANRVLTSFKAALNVTIR
ncbi:MAG: hypothetical protein ACYCZX_13505, partial [Rhodospirillaceae bacterium]